MKEAAEHPRLVIRFEWGRCVCCGQIGYVARMCEQCPACVNVALLMWTKRTEKRSS